MAKIALDELITLLSLLTQDIFLETRLPLFPVDRCEYIYIYTIDQVSLTSLTLSL